MTEYVACPHCRGRGLVPLEDAERQRVHVSVERSEAEQAQRHLREEMTAQRAAEMRAAAARRQARLDSAISSMSTGHAEGRTPEEITELRARLARLQGE